MRDGVYRYLLAATIFVVSSFHKNKQDIVSAFALNFLNLINSIKVDKFAV